jgi:hypothetical protein
LVPVEPRPAGVSLARPDCHPDILDLSMLSVAQRQIVQATRFKNLKNKTFFDCHYVNENSPNQEI